MTQRSLIRLNESDASRPDTEWTQVPPDGSCEAILSILSDEGCRAILSAADVPRTAKELAEACDLPISTVYRKLDRIESTPLLEESTRVRLYGKHPQQYQRRGDRIQLRLPPDYRFDVDVTVRPPDCG